MPKIRRRSDRTIIKTPYLAFLLIPLVFAPNLARPAVYTVMAGSDTKSPAQVSFQPATAPATLTQAEVKAYVRQEGRKAGVNLQKLDWLFGHESSFCWREGFYDPAIKGDDGNSRGCAQISRIWHPEVTDAEANNLVWAVHWTINQILAGKMNEWSTIRLCRKLYSDCPF